MVLCDKTRQMFLQQWEYIDFVCVYVYFVCVLANHYFVMRNKKKIAQLLIATTQYYNMYYRNQFSFKKSLDFHWLLSEIPGLLFSPPRLATVWLFIFITSRLQIYATTGSSISGPMIKCASMNWVLFTKEFKELRPGLNLSQ